MNPIFIEDNFPVAADSNTANVIAENESLRRYLRAPFRAKGKLVAVGTGVLTVNFDYGSKNVVSNSNLRVASTMQEPDDVLNEDFYVDEGDQLVLNVINQTAGALNILYRLVLEPWEGEFPPDMRTMQMGPIAIADGTVDQQLLDGTRYERPPVPCMLAVLMTASATGLLRQLYVDTDSIAPPSDVNPTNRVPLTPFDLSIDGVQVPEDKLISLSVSNASGGSLNVFWKAQLKEYFRK